MDTGPLPMCRSFQGSTFAWINRNFLVLGKFLFFDMCMCARGLCAFSKLKFKWSSVISCSIKFHELLMVKTKGAKIVQEAEDPDPVVLFLTRSFLSHVWIETTCPAGTADFQQSGTSLCPSSSTDTKASFSHFPLDLCFPCLPHLFLSKKALLKY